MMQKARTPHGVLALYLASKLDPHFLVRTKATEALDILVICRRDCFKDVFSIGDELVKKLRGKYKPGADDCGIVFDECCASIGMTAGAATPSVGTTLEASPPVRSAGR
jgi:hypothetical protein